MSYLDEIRERYVASQAGTTCGDQAIGSRRNGERMRKQRERGNGERERKWRE